MDSLIHVFFRYHDIHFKYMYSITERVTYIDMLWLTSPYKWLLLVREYIFASHMENILLKSFQAR